MSISDNLENGLFLSPQTRPQNNSMVVSGGLMYDHNMNVITRSIDRRFKPITFDQTLPIDNRLDSNYLYLGYYFRHYGHFILETLPMLAYCIDNKFTDLQKIFLPFFLNPKNINNNILKSTNLKLIYDFLFMLNINIDTINYHIYNTNLKTNFLIPNKSMINLYYYRLVINKIHSRFKSVKPFRKIFILRKPSKHRVSSTITTMIENYMINIGFELIDMTKLNIEQQILLMYESSTIVGFSGSGMHNSMFLQPNNTAITLCDLRDFKAPKCCIPNQKLCDQISECNNFFINFNCGEGINKKDLLHNNLSHEQELYAAQHIIKNLNHLL